MFGQPEVPLEESARKIRCAALQELLIFQREELRGDRLEELDAAANGSLTKGWCWRFTSDNPQFDIEPTNNDHDPEKTHPNLFFELFGGSS